MMHRYSFLLAGMIALVGCGKNSDKKTTTLSTIQLPSIDFALPTAANLALTVSSDILLDTQQRVNDRIEKLNADMVKWNTEFPAVGTFTNKGPDKDKSGSLTEISEGNYKYKLVLCEAGKLHMVVKWSADNKNIYSWRNQRYKPEPVENSSILMTYAETDASKTFTQKFFGEKDGGSADETDLYLAHYITASEQISTGVFTFSSVQDRFSSLGSTYSATPDGYLVGRMNTDATSGVAVSWRADAPGDGSTTCASTFNESSIAGSWCKLRVIGSATTETTASGAWTNVLAQEGLSITNSSNLSDPTETETCPE